jgi:hypothetical protein
MGAVQQSDIENICFIASQINVIYFVLWMVFPPSFLLNEKGDTIWYYGEYFI